VLFLLELLFVRKGVLSCPLMSADDMDMFFLFFMHFLMRINHNYNNSRVAVSLNSMCRGGGMRCNECRPVFR